MHTLETDYSAGTVACANLGCQRQTRVLGHQLPFVERTGFDPPAVGMHLQELEHGVVPAVGTD